VEEVSCEGFAADARGTTSSTQDNQVMVVVHNGGLMFLHSALQVPVTHPQWDKPAKYSFQWSLEHTVEERGFQKNVENRLWSPI